MVPLLATLLVSRWRHKSLRQSPSSSPRPFSHSTVRAFAGVQTFSGPSLTCSFIPEPMQNAFHKAGMLVLLIAVLVAPESSLLCYKELQKSHDHIWSAHMSSLAWNNWNHAFIPLVEISSKHPLKGSEWTLWQRSQAVRSMVMSQLSVLHKHRSESWQQSGKLAKVTHQGNIPVSLKFGRFSSSRVSSMPRAIYI